MALNNPYALSFDGVDDYVESGDIIEGLAGQSTITVEAIVKREQALDASILANTNYHKEPRVGGIQVRVLASGHLRAVVAQNVGGLFSADTVNPVLSLGTAKHIAVVLGADAQAKKILFYVEGVLVPRTSFSYTGTYSQRVLPDGDLLNIGRVFFSTGPTNFLSGAVDEIRIWAGERTQEEINLYKNRRLSGDEENLLAYYRFDSGSGNTVLDSSPNANHGTIYGATWVDGLVDLISATGHEKIASATAYGAAIGTAKPLLGNMGWALQCDGIDDYISLGTLGNFGRQRRNSIIEITFKTPPNYAPGRVVSLFGTYNIGTVSAAIMVVLCSDYNSAYTPGKLHFYIRADNNNTISCEITNHTIYDGQYHTIKIDYTDTARSNLQVFVDDQKQTLSYRLKYNIGTCSNLAQPLLVGARYTFREVIDTHANIIVKDIKITVNDTIFAEYPIYEGTGTTINDTSGNGYHGTIYGASWITDALISISTISADNISASRMNIKGELLDLGDHTQAECYFQYTTDPNFNTGIIETPHQIMTTTGEFEQLVTNLDNSNTYYYRAVADYID